MQVLTLNVWGLWLVSQRRGDRIRSLGEYLAASAEDVVLLQEVWVDSDAQALIEAGARGGLRHARHFRVGAFGSGLLTLSRTPLLAHAFWPYAAAGDPLAVTCGDFYASKGVGWVRVHAPGVGVVDVYNTHLHANYAHHYDALELWDGRRCRVPHDVHAATRLAQTLQLAQIVRQVSGDAGTAVVLGGDLNNEPDDLPMVVLSTLLPRLRDAWESTNPQQPGLTCRAAGNSFTPRRQVPERIDYVWTDLQCVRADLALQQAPCGVSYSDHFAVRVVLERAAALTASPRSTPAVPKAAARLSLPPVLRQAVWVVLSTGQQRTRRAYHACMQLLVLLVVGGGLGRLRSRRGLRQDCWCLGGSCRRRWWRRCARAWRRQL